MISFELIQCDGGWEWIWLPDNMVVAVSTDAGTLEFHVALRELVLFTVMVREKEYGKQVVGTGGQAWIHPSEESGPDTQEMVEIGVADVGETVTYADALEATESLLFDAFARHDEYQPEERSDALRRLNTDLEKRGLPPIADELYADYLEQIG